MKFRVSIASLCRNQRYEPPCAEAVSPLVDAVMHEIKEDIRQHDLTALDELLRFVPRKFLIGYLRDEKMAERFRRQGKTNGKK